MIDSQSYEKTWLKARKSKYQRANPELTEKVIHAMSLAESLKNWGLDYVFKGGTSLFLMLPEPQKFSIDVDIITSAPREKLESVLSDLCTSSPSGLQRFQLDENRSYQPTGIPKAHYSFWFISKLDQQEKHILLDVLYGEHDYPEIQEIPIQSEWLKTSGEPCYVTTPSLESLTGDKLTAFAPNTTGILYSKGKELEIIKQLFDLQVLFDRISHLEMVKKSFNALVSKEIAYRNSAGLITREEVLDDIIQTALLLVYRDRQLDDMSSSCYQELKRGISKIDSHLFVTRFRVDDAVVAASKVAYLAALIKVDYQGEIRRFEQTINDTICSDLNKQLKNIKKGEALFYWYQTMSLLT